jgi:hypothetical protein
MTHQQADELLQIGKSIVRELAEIGEALRALVAAIAKAPPSSKRGGKKS